MATNQQLKDYIEQQTKLGVPETTIKSALVGAGWSESDVTQALAEFKGGTQQPASPTTPSQPASSVQPLKRTISSPASGASFSPAASKSSSFVTSDIFQPKGEAVFKPGASAKPAASDNLQSFSAGGNVGAAKPAKSGGNNIITIVLGVLSIILLGGNVYFYFQNEGLRSQPAGQGNAAASQQASQITSLTNDKNSLTQQVDSLNKNIADLTNQLAIFEPAASSSIKSASFDVGGTVGGGGKAYYSLTTSKNIVLTVKNSGDADVDAVLKLLVGKQAELAGTHAPESTQLTVATVNGMSLQDALKSLTAPAVATTTETTATTTAATTTAPAATAPATTTSRATTTP